MQIFLCILKIIALFCNFYIKLSDNGSLMN